ncbi:RNA 2'-phosphotransferase [Pseudoalteromonas sp. CO348]|uniref:RNA 2'-phosphotransferase n=1 Tax=unclassified Pseudoalteromonas TaxID=194690 RepID=UPI001022FE61|nr:MULTISPECIES: RNA 2'-phosphotransferase [unclassified Pseudoalteromonas]MCG7541929.1 RNA 2'-phosphotransferase [Pseudoalteromonas sp. OF7H-1]RZG04146.1 RNA 2'-phosphotransferase [Pseudoalteromonas sp. CO348]
MTSNQLNKVSKFLSFVLRHKPDAIGLELDQYGWANINELISKAYTSNGLSNLSFDLIQQVVETNEKKRFIISDDNLRIRANQGHSVDVDLQLRQMEPPEFLYHGSATRFLDNILAQGLIPQERLYVHLSSNIDTAKAAGQRYGKPIILKIKARAMYESGFKFYLSENEVWLTKQVPAELICI